MTGKNISGEDHNLVRYSTVKFCHWGWGRFTVLNQKVKKIIIEKNVYPGNNYAYVPVPETDQINCCSQSEK
jgi:hypothetical protein